MGLLVCGRGYKSLALLILIVGVSGLELTILAVWEIKAAVLVSGVEIPEAEDEYNYHKNYELQHNATVMPVGKLQIPGPPCG